MEWEKIFANHISEKGLISKKRNPITQQLKKTNKKNPTNNLIRRWVKYLNRHFSEEEKHKPTPQ